MLASHMSIACLLVSLSCSPASADDLAVFMGAGPQPGSDQRNNVFGFEYSFFTLKRSDRQHFQLGVAYAQFESNVDPSRKLHSFSIFPQLTFYPPATSKLALAMPDGVQTYFYTRMLGPTYINRTSLGLRNQANHFSFHAQVGAGFLFDLQDGTRGIAHISWRHISNANLFSPNDGIDVPLMITIGIRY